MQIYPMHRDQDGDSRIPEIYGAMGLQTGLLKVYSQRHPKACHIEEGIPMIGFVAKTMTSPMFLKELSEVDTAQRRLCSSHQTRCNRVTPWC